jgi:hypothetical protein
MNKCVFYIESAHFVTVCGHDAPFMYHGSSYCDAHIETVLKGKTWSEL